MCNFWIENIVRRETRNFIAEQRRKTKTPTHFFLLFRSGKRPVILGNIVGHSSKGGASRFRRIPPSASNRA
jgi:hypothetical protein